MNPAGEEVGFKGAPGRDRSYTIAEDENRTAGAGLLVGRVEDPSQFADELREKRAWPIERRCHGETPTNRDKRSGSVSAMCTEWQRLRLEPLMLRCRLEGMRRSLVEFEMLPGRLEGKCAKGLPQTGGYRE